MLAAASEACPPGAPSRMATQNGAASTSAAIPAAVLHKEAIYAAVGTGAYELHDFIDYQPWLRTTLVQVNQLWLKELQNCPGVMNQTPEQSRK